MSTFVFAQTNKITFTYDEAGNQKNREFCPYCPAKNSGSIPKEIDQLTENDLLKFFPEDVISYYPNPVKESLYIKWVNENDNQVTSINIFSLSGQLLKSFNNLNGRDNFTISFNDLPQNVYSVNLIYTKGEQKPIKIIKQ